jgi:hypothetical protein
MFDLLNNKENLNVHETKDTLEYIEKCIHSFRDDGKIKSTVFLPEGQTSFSEGEGGEVNLRRGGGVPLDKTLIKSFFFYRDHSTMY